MDLTNTYLGFTDNMKPMQRARAEKLLDDKKRYNGTVLTNKQFALNQIMEGCIPQIKDDVCHYSRKLHDYTQPKTEYYLKTKDDPYWTIEKTLYNFAVYLITKEFTYEARVETFIKEEQDKKVVEQQKIEQEKLAQQQIKEDQEQAKINFKNWINEQVENYNNSEQVELLEEIRLAELGEFSQRSIRLLVFIDNIDNPMCREELKGWLHSGNPTSKKVFYHITGIKLPSTNKGTYEVLDNITKEQYKGIVPFKQRQKHDKNIQKFYKMITVPEPHFEECQGEVFNKYGLSMFITKNNEKYIITEGRSGVMACSGATKTGAKRLLDEQINKVGIEKLQGYITQAVERYGLSPLYKQEVAV